MQLSFWSGLVSVWNTIWPILIAIVLFGLIVVIHEFGHFFFAKLFKIQVNEFAVGFGPAVFKRQKGETLYALRVVPFGGFCAMEGEDEQSDNPRAFGNKKVWQRFIVVAAGAVNNLLLGFIIVGVMLAVQGQFGTTQVAGFAENAKSHETGLQAGDVIWEVDGRRVYCSSDLSYMLMVSEDDTLHMTVRRGDQMVELEGVQFFTQEVDGQSYIAVDFGVVAEEMTIKNPLTFLKSTALESVSIGRVVWMSLIDLIGGRFGLNEMMGPVGVVSTVSESVSNAVGGSGVDIANLLYLMALITINLGMMNLLPLPALDGGRLVFLTAEGIFRKPVPAKYEGWIHAAGFVLLIVLILVITGNDILRLIRGS